MPDKRCSKCGEVKPLTSFGVRRSRCKSCVAANTRAWQKRNLERARETTRRWRQTEKGKASNRAYVARWARHNPEKVRAYRKVWAQTEKGQAALRRAREKWLAAHPLSLETPHGVGILLDRIADDRAVNPLEALIQDESIRLLINRAVSERGLDYEVAYQLAHSYL